MLNKNILFPVWCQESLLWSGTWCTIQINWNNCNSFISIYSNGASGAAPKQGVAALDREPDFFVCLFLIYMNCASGAGGVAAPYGAPDFYFQFIYSNLFELCITCRFSAGSRSITRDTRLFVLCFIYYILFEWCIRYCSTTRNRGTRRGTRLFLLLNYSFILIIYLNCESGAAIQQGVAAPDGAPDFLIIKLSVYFNNLFELCIMCRSTTLNRSTGRDTRLFFNN